MLSPASELVFVTTLAAVLDSNKTGSVSSDVAYEAIALAIHNAPQAGATFLDTTTPTPILYTVA
jgi:hypothetical protein